jgi:hypothetical protein
MIRARPEGVYYEEYSKWPHWLWLQNVTSHSSLAGSSAVTPRLSDTLWFNALWFQSLWFCTVMGREVLLPLALVLLVVHVWLAGDRRSEVRQLLLVGGLGIAVDAALGVAGVYIFAGGALVPLWLCCLWLGFAAVLGRSLAWLAARPLVCFIAGAVAFPLNYWAGQRLGAVEFGYALPVTLAVLAIIWGVVLPAMFWLTARLQLSDARSAP